MRTKLFFVALIIVLLFSDCAVTEKISPNGKAGSSYTTIVVKPFFVEVLEDFGEFLPKENESIMDTAMAGFASTLDKLIATKEVDFKKAKENHYELLFTYSDLTDLIQELGANNQTLFNQTNTSLSFYVDINNYIELTKVVPFLSDPNFEVYGPEYNQGTSEEDYLDMIYYLLGEEGPDAIKEGYVDIYINTPSKITKAEGATIINEKEALFSFPIIDFLLLNKPLTFSITWK